MTANQLESLLCRPVWDAKDVALYCSCSLPTAYELIEDLRGPDMHHKKDGWCDMPRRVRRDAILRHYATDPKTEMSIAMVSKFYFGFVSAIEKVIGGENDG